MRLIFSAFGFQQAARRVQGIGDRAVNAAPAMAAIGQLLREIEREQFETSGGRSRPWQPLAAATVQRKVRQGFSLDILRETGRLQESLTQQGHPDQVFEVSASSVLFGSRREGAGFHQTGTSKMPQRQPVYLTESDRRKMVRMVRRFMLSGVPGG